MAPLLLLLLLAAPATAQDGLPLFRPSTEHRDSSILLPAGTGPEGHAPGAVTVHESERIKALMADYASKKQPLKGYRVQIFLGERGTAESVRLAFMQKYPEIPAYLSYLPPNFRVRVGDLRDRVAAEFLRESLKSEFPGLYIVPDDIEPPRLHTPTEGD